MAGAVVSALVLGTALTGNLADARGVGVNPATKFGAVLSSSDTTSKKPNQTITHTSTPPTNPTAGDTNIPSGTSGGSGTPVRSSVGSLTTQGACSTSNGGVPLTGAGMCLEANQKQPEAPRARLPVGIAPLGNQATRVSVSLVTQPQAITYTSTPPTDPTVGGTYMPSGTGGGSGSPVTFSVDSSSTSGACSMNGSTVSFSGEGTCVIDANQAGVFTYSAAPQVQQSFTVGLEALNSEAIVGMADNGVLGAPAATQARQLADMHNNLHLSSIRFDANWSLVQSGSNSSYFDWSTLDQGVRSALAAGMSIDLIIDGCPTWASPNCSTTSTSSQPAPVAEYAQWAQEVTARYSPLGVNIFEIGNEPNTAPNTNPAIYTADLIAADRAIKLVDPKATVILGGLAATHTSASQIDPVTFLADVYEDGVRGFFDAVGFHPYSAPALPDDPGSWSGWSQMPGLRAVMVANGDAAKQVWITEVGWPTNVASETGIAGPIAAADDIAQVFAFAEDNSWVGPIYIYSYEDEGSDPTNNRDWFGLVSASGAQKPAYSVIAAVLAEQ